MRAAVLIVSLGLGLGFGLGCGPRSAATPGPAAGAAPRLVVLVVVDELPAWAFDARLGELRGGFATAVARGRRYVGEYPSAATSTAAGHATLGTGASPRDTGILANAWYRRDHAREIAAVEDPDGAWTTAALRVPGLADALAAAAPRARAVAVALKPRAALLPLGQRAGLAVWYDGATASWKT